MIYLNYNKLNKLSIQKINPKSNKTNNIIKGGTIDINDVTKTIDKINFKNTKKMDNIKFIL